VQAPTIDGRLADDAWNLASWNAEPFGDIAALFHEGEYSSPPAGFGSRFKLLWDDSFFYLAAELEDLYISGSTVEHNAGPVPYKDNDFEAFFDVSGTTHYYKEYEMSATNGTYDVLWRATDPSTPGEGGVPCNASVPWRPEGGVWCSNSSDHDAGFSGDWTMAPALRSAARLNVSGAASDPVVDDRGDFPFTPRSVPAPRWTAEVAFPISAAASGPAHGGLTDTERSVAPGGVLDFSRFDPNRTPPNSTRPRYWRANFARTQHPLARGLGAATTAQCDAVQRRIPTLLGDMPWSCYWSWTWQQMGATRYLHYPDMWGVVEFQFAEGGGEAARGGAAWCRDLEWPGRHVATTLFWAQYAHFQRHGNYSASATALATPEYCSYDPPREATSYCRLADLQRALSGPQAAVFSVGIELDVQADRCVIYPRRGAPGRASGGACFTAVVNVTTPGPRPARYSARVQADRFTTVEWDAQETGAAGAPAGGGSQCL
jgi:hypothetical protein